MIIFKYFLNYIFSQFFLQPRAAMLLNVTFGSADERPTAWNETIGLEEYTACGRIFHPRLMIICDALGIYKWK